MLKGTEAPHWQPDRKSAASQEPTKIQDITKRGPKLVKNTDYCPLLLLYVGMNDSRSWNTSRIKEDYKALGAQVKNTGAQITLFLILPVGGKKAARNRHQFTAMWLQPVRSDKRNHENNNLLGSDRIHLFRRGRAIFGSRWNEWNEV